jgi:stearoyl-CoA desaturase (delta-9 desaturase)
MSAHQPVEAAPPSEPLERLTAGGRLLTLAAVIVPFIGLVVASCLLWGWGFSRAELGLLAGMYLLTGLGITVGFHRLFAHRSFETYGAVKFLLAVFGSMAVQSALFHWVAHHRLHHGHSDTPEDPHSPHNEGGGLLGWLKGFWHAHIGWAFEPDKPNLTHYVQDLHRSRSLRVANALFPLWVALGLLIPAAAGGLLLMSWAGAVRGLLWGGLVRILLVHHVTWSVNSVCHIWGLRPYKSGDESRDNFVLGVLALGEGWHNTHHAFPTSARHGLRWWKLDLSYWAIRALALAGLAWNLKVPSKKAEEQKLRA